MIYACSPLFFFFFFFFIIVIFLFLHGREAHPARPCPLRQRGALEGHGGELHGLHTVAAPTSVQHQAHEQQRQSLARAFVSAMAMIAVFGWM